MLRAVPVMVKNFDLKEIPAAIANMLFTWQARASERHFLAQLDSRLLHDIGLTRQQALDEADKPFWRL